MQFGVSKLNNTYFIVTGGSGGIGASICEQLSNIGITPIICYKTNYESANSIARKTNGIPLQLDFSSPSEISRKLNTLIKTIEDPSKIKGAIIAASPPPKIGAPVSIDTRDLENHFLISVIGVHVFLSNLIQLFKKNKCGTIVSILSEAIGNSTLPPNKNMGAYVIAKTAQKTLLSLYSQEYPWLTIHTINPSFTKTKMLDVFDKRYIELLDNNSKIFEPSDIAKMVIRLINHE